MHAVPHEPAWLELAATTVADATAGAVAAGFGAAGRAQNCGPGPAVRSEALPARSAARRNRREVFMTR